MLDDTGTPFRHDILHIMICISYDYEMHFREFPAFGQQHFRHPTYEQLRQLDIYRSRTSDRGLSSLSCLL